jgi:hypothetical protein
MTIPEQGDDERQDYSSKPEPEDKPKADRPVWHISAGDIISNVSITGFASHSATGGAFPVTPPEQEASRPIPQPTLSGLSFSWTTTLTDEQYDYFTSLFNEPVVYHDPYPEESE